MEELINKIKESAGISSEQATKALEAVKNYVIAQFPMMEGAVEKLFSSTSQPDDDML